MSVILFTWPFFARKVGPEAAATIREELPDATQFEIDCTADRVRFTLFKAMEQGGVDEAPAFQEIRNIQPAYKQGLTKRRLGTIPVY